MKLPSMRIILSSSRKWVAFCKASHAWKMAPAFYPKNECRVSEQIRAERKGLLLLTWIRFACSSWNLTLYSMPFTLTSRCSIFIRCTRN